MVSNPGVGSLGSLLVASSEVRLSQHDRPNPTLIDDDSFNITIRAIYIKDNV